MFLVCLSVHIGVPPGLCSQFTSLVSGPRSFGGGGGTPSPVAGLVHGHPLPDRTGLGYPSQDRIGVPQPGQHWVPLQPGQNWGTPRTGFGYSHSKKDKIGAPPA